MRVTAFPGDVVPVEGLSWWDDAVGFPPETVVSRPRTGQYEAHGDFEGRRLTLRIKPGRIEWTLGPVVKEDEEPSLPMLGAFPENVTSLLKVVDAWRPLAPALKRIAVGATLRQPVDNVRGGYVLLQQYLHSNVRLDPDTSSDFFYQINRPRPATSGLPGLKMNRLMRWSVQVAQRMTLTLGAGGAVARNLGEEAALRLEIDINTPPDLAEALPADKLGPILQEMANLGGEIVERGDIQ